MFKVLVDGCEPTKGSKHSACVDLRAAKDIVIGAGETAIIPLGVCIDLSDDPLLLSMRENHYLQLEPRSSLRAKGLQAGTGIIDMDFVYPNEIKLIVQNPLPLIVSVGDVVAYEPFIINKGDRVAQIMLCEHKSYLFGIESEDERTAGIGSTGER